MDQVTSLDLPNKNTLKGPVLLHCFPKRQGVDHLIAKEPCWHVATDVVQIPGAIDFLQEAPEKNCSDLHPRIDCPDESGHEMQKKLASESSYTTDTLWQFNMTMENHHF